LSAGAETRGAAAARRWGKPVLLALSVIGVFTVPYFLVVLSPDLSFGYDAYAYWSVDPANPYVLSTGSVSTFGAFRYTPVIAWLFAPFGLLPWPVFLVGWTAFLLALLAWMGRRYTLALLAFAPIVFELHYGNINLVIAAIVVAGFRWPALWSLVILTKPTAAIALLWFLPRRWRAIAVAFGAAALIALPSLVARPDLWTQWVSATLGSAGQPQPLPVLWRLPFAAAVALWGGLTGRAWAVPVAATIAMPQTWWTSLAVLAAVPATLTRVRVHGARAVGPATDPADP
jgi:hypothetical protein